MSDSDAMAVGLLYLEMCIYLNQLNATHYQVTLGAFPFVEM